MRTRIFIATAAVLALAAAIIYALPSEKKRLVRDIKRLGKAVEEERRADVLAGVDTGYADAQGAQFEGLASALDELFGNADSIRVTLARMKPVIDSTRSGTIYAHCSLGLRVTAHYAGDPVIVYGSIVQPTPVVGYFRRRGCDYRLYSAEY